MLVDMEHFHVGRGIDHHNQERHTKSQLLAARLAGRGSNKRGAESTKSNSHHQPLPSSSPLPRKGERCGKFSQSCQSTR